MPLKLNIKAVYVDTAVLHERETGPIFGKGRDLSVSDKSNINNHSYVRPQSYDAPNKQTESEGATFIHGGPSYYFQTIEIEVYLVNRI